MAPLWLLRLLLSREDRRVVSSDLEELYQARLARDGVAAADRWRHRELERYTWRLLAERLLHPLGRKPAGELMQNLVRDTRHSLRTLARTPVLAATIMLTVGLGIGATTAIFAVIDAALLRPLPYNDPGNLVRIYTDAPPNRWGLSVADYQAMSAQQTTFKDIAAYQSVTRAFTRGDVAERITGRVVTWNYFSLLGVAPLLGRAPSASDGVPGSSPTVVVSYGLWKRQLGGDRAVLGQAIQLDGVAHLVVGVLPPMSGPLEAGRDFFATAQWGPPPRKGPFTLVGLGRLSDHTSRAAAAEELRAIDKRIFPIWQSGYTDATASWGMVDLQEAIVGNVGTTLFIVLGAVAFVLLIACANAANLLVARATHRGRELAVRSALGASRARLLQHLLTESGVLALGAALIGLTLALGGMQLVSSFGSRFIPRTEEIGLHGRTLWFMLAIAAGSGLLFGLIPALQIAGSHLEENLRSGGRSITDSVGARRVRRALVVGQFAVATPLLIAAGLLIVSLAKLRKVDPGYDPRGIVTASIQLQGPRYPRDSANARLFLDQLGSRVEGLPGVRAVAFSDSRPPAEVGQLNNFNLEAHPTPDGQQQRVGPWVAVTPKYFQLLGVPLIAGRLFDARDYLDSAQNVFIVDQGFAQRYFPGEEVVGKRMSEGCTECPWITIVGVVGNVKYTGIDQPDVGTVYQPLYGNFGWGLNILVRTADDPMRSVPAIRRIVHELDPGVPLASVATIDDLTSVSLQTPRYLSLLVGSFAGVALLLSVIGIYGVMSYFVQQHAKDIGIRIALGGAPGNVARMVVGQGMRVVGIGVAIGLAGALALTRYMTTRLFEVAAVDPLTYGVTASLLVGVALVACLLPARRAAAVDPVTMLRDE